MEATSDPLVQRENFIKILSPKQKAVFSFLENVDKLEKTTISSEVKANAKWNSGSTETLLKRALELKDPSYLPLPSSHPYEAFGLTIKYEPTEDDRKLSPVDLFQKRRQLEKGSSDMRIYDSEESLQFFANTGSLDSMQDEWATLIDDIPYPMLVRDRNGFLYTNPAFQAAAK